MVIKRQTLCRKKGQQQQKRRRHAPGANSRRGNHAATTPRSRHMLLTFLVCPGRNSSLAALYSITLLITSTKDVMFPVQYVCQQDNVKTMGLNFMKLDGRMEHG